MTRSLVGLPLRLGRRGAGLALNVTVGVAEHGLSVAARVADTVLDRDQPDLDFDGTEHRHEPRPQPPRRPASRPRRQAPAGGPDQGAGATPEDRPQPAPLEGEATHVASEPPPLEEEPPHVSSEPTLVQEVAEAGAEDGAGAQVHVDEPWEGYGQMTAGDVIDRITGADSAVLAAVELYELTARRRQTVLDAVRRELNRSERDQ